ncbi:hypothetical protein EV363DRAFT_1162926, partial [Boletus edulis]
GGSNFGIVTEFTVRVHVQAKPTCVRPQALLGHYLPFYQRPGGENSSAHCASKIALALPSLVPHYVTLRLACTQVLALNGNQIYQTVFIIMWACHH